LQSDGPAARCPRQRFRPSTRANLVHDHRSGPAEPVRTLLRSPRSLFTCTQQQPLRKNLHVRFALRCGAKPRTPHAFPDPRVRHCGRRTGPGRGLSARRPEEAVARHPTHALAHRPVSVGRTRRRRRDGPPAISFNRRELASPIYPRRRRSARTMSGDRIRRRRGRQSRSHHKRNPRRSRWHHA